MIFSFWFSLFIIFYAYLGYPLTLWVLSYFFYKGRKRYVKEKPTYQPKVSLLISAYNEEGVIENKINNSLKLDYPKELLEIVVISDGSNDKTNEIVDKYKNRGVLLRNYEGRIGKTACLNKAVPISKGDVIIFSDANSLYDKDAILHLVKHFGDKSIGYVTGHTKYTLAVDSKALQPIGLYSKLEKITKILESRIGSCVGADGAIFAIRKGLYKQLNNYDINDFVIPLNIIRNGFKGIIDEKAFCSEGAAKDTSGEFDRQARITNRTIRAIFNNADMLNPLRYGVFSFQLISHKLSKYLVPLFLITLLLSNVLLLNQGAFYILTLSAQIIFYSLFYLECKNNCYKHLVKFSALAKTFITVNLAILLGWVQYFKGKTYTTWLTTR